MSDFIPYKIGFNSAACIADITDTIDACLDELSINFQEIIIKQIRANGNGSTIMKDEAVSHVKEFSRKINGGTVELEVGVDEDIGDEQARIRTVVVLHGNGQIWTKPGASTWKKHVNYQSTNIHSVISYRIVDFEQTDVSGKLLENSMKEVDKYVNDFLEAIEAAIDLIDFSEYVI